MLRQLKRVQTHATLISVAITILFTGCSVSPQHHVRTGADPRYEDKDVAFRTTYYFRVFDYCSGQDSARYVKGAIPPTNALYRFKMTGKAKTSTNKIKFESGILKSWQIDPLGATVIYDKNIGRHRYVSENETQNEAIRKRAWVDFTQLQAEYLRLSEQFGQEAQIKNLLTTKLISTLTEGSAIDETALANSITEQFVKSNSRLKTLNGKLETAIATGLKANQASILETNKAKITELLLQVAQSWLIQQIINHVQKQVESQLNTQQLPDNVFQSDDAKAKWDKVIENLTPTMVFTGEQKDSAVLSLASAFKIQNDISNISLAKITVSGKETLAAQHLASTYIDALGNNSAKADLTHLRSTYDGIFTQLKSDLTPKDGDAKLLTDQERTKIKERLISHTEHVLKTNNTIFLSVANISAPINFAANSSNILAVINKQNILSLLQATSTPLIETAVENTHYLASSDIQSTLETLKSAMNSQLRVATNTLSSSSATAQSEFRVQSESRPIDCTQVNEQRGFQILGPEGWRTFNPDERLIMAMYSDNSPITQVLKQLSQQVLNAHGSNEPNLLPVVQAELRLSHARQQLIEQKSTLAATAVDKKPQALCELVNQVNKQLHSAETITPTHDCDGE